MYIKSLIMFGVTLLMTPILSAELMPEIKLAGGTLVFDPSGAMTLRAEQGDILLSTGYFAPGWGPRSQWQLLDGVKFTKVGPSEWTWESTFEQKEATMTLLQTVTSSSEQVDITYELRANKGFLMEPAAKGPFFVAEILTPDNEGKEINVSGKSVLLPQTNVWSFGNRVVFKAWNFEVKTDSGASISVWDVKKGAGSSIRIPMKKSDDASDGQVIYKRTINLM